MERHQGNWKVEGEEEYNIGELVIDNDYIEFFVRGTGRKRKFNHIVCGAVLV